MSQITIALTKGRIEEDTVKLLTQARGHWERKGVG